MSEFTHLHLHTQYSLLDGAIRMGDLFPRIAKLGMDTVAATDHGNMFGAVDFYTRAKEHGIKPIFGCETYIADTDRHDRTNRRTYHLILLAKNDVGYQNLSFLNSKGYLEGFYYNPRIDKEILRKHSEGLIGLSACLGGEVAQTLLKHGVEKAEEVAKEYKDIFALGDFYLEMMPNGLEDQETINEEYKRMGPKLGIPLVATNDCHYVHPQDSKAHNILLCIQSGKTVSDPKRLRHEVAEYFIKSPQQMNDAFNDVPQAIESTVDIARRCNVELDLTKSFLPKYELPKDYTEESYIKKIADEGLIERFKEFEEFGAAFDVDEYQDRLAHELMIINEMGFPGYFLVVWDFIRWAKTQDIPVGPGRGSGAGSLVAYVMGITNIDPIRYKLLFERFLNPERVSMPDFDIDFCMNRRDEVVHYVKDKYGTDHVGNIATFHQLKARGVIRDVARVMELPYSDADKLAKLIPDPIQGKTISINKAIAQEKELKKQYDENNNTKELLTIASSLEGLNRHVGTHAAGIVICDKPVWDYVPCFRGQNNEIVTQFAMKEVEKSGLIKFDFLGLKTLTMVENAVKIINEQKTNDDVFDINQIPLDDALTYTMIARGDTTGVFQLESSGCRAMLKRLEPDQFEDIVAAVALYRPGPLEGGMVDDFIDRKHGRKEVVYQHPLLESILSDTYGVIVYQEQVMQIAQVLSNYSLGNADLLRRAMGKKDKKVMAKQKQQFVSGAKKNNVPQKIAQDIFELVEYFAGYGFNRSHSVSYGLISYQTAYLKTHFPHEFIAGVLSCEHDNVDNIIKFISLANSMNVSVTNPDVNDSADCFTVVIDEDGKKIVRFGLGAIKGIGNASVSGVLSAREQGGPFVSLFDFVNRVDSKKVNKRVLEALIKGGAFDCFCNDKIHRAMLFESITVAVEEGTRVQRDKHIGQESLFGNIESNDSESDNLLDKYTATERWQVDELLAFEKETLGVYLTGHPLDNSEMDFKRFSESRIKNVLEGRQKVGYTKLGGVITGYRERSVRRGDGKIAFCNLEDKDGVLDVVVLPKVLDSNRTVLKSGEPVLCHGKIVDEGEGDEHDWRMLLSDAKTFSSLRETTVEQFSIQLTMENLNEDNMEKIEKLKKILLKAKGECHVVLNLCTNNDTVVIPLNADYNATPTANLLSSIRLLFGVNIVRFDEQI